MNSSEMFESLEERKPQHEVLVQLPGGAVWTIDRIEWAPWLEPKGYATCPQVIILGHIEATRTKAEHLQMEYKVKSYLYSLSPDERQAFLREMGV